jgi:hypothetical protein
MNETDEEFLDRLEEAGKDWRISNDLIGLIVRKRYPRQSIPEAIAEWLPQSK